MAGLPQRPQILWSAGGTRWTNRRTVVLSIQRQLYSDLTDTGFSPLFLIPPKQKAMSWSMRSPLPPKTNILYRACTKRNERSSDMIIYKKSVYRYQYLQKLLTRLNPGGQWTHPCRRGELFRTPFTSVTAWSIQNNTKHTSQPECLHTDVHTTFLTLHNRKTVSW